MIKKLTNINIDFEKHIYQQRLGSDQNPPAEEWINVLKRIRDAGKLCQLYVIPDGARKIVNELGGKGFAFYIWTETSHDEACRLV